jgi:ribosomal protein S21
MNSFLYFKRVKQVMNERGISQEAAQSYLGKKGAEARKRKVAAQKEKELKISEMWWNKD